jgi:serine protease
MPFKMRGPARTDPALELQLLQETAKQLKDSDHRIKYAHPNWIIDTNPLPPRVPIDVRDLDSMVVPLSADPSQPNDYAFIRGLHWDYAAPPMGMNAVGAWKLGTGSRDVVVAVVDTGILLDHPDIKDSGNVLPGYNFVGFDGRGPDPNDRGNACPPVKPHPDWHGTHVAGTIGAVASNNKLGITGINWDVSVVPVRVLGRCGGSIQEIVAGMRWAAGLPVDGVPPEQMNKHPAHIINLSLGAGLPCNYETVGLFIDALDDVRAKGAVVVVAAGNSGVDVRDFYPSGCKGVISVSASDRVGHLTSYSNFGNVTIMAPGGDLRPNDETGHMPAIWSTVQVSTISPQGIEPMPGTSMAAPHVAGALALALAKHPDWRGKPDLIEQKLRASAVPIADGACPHACGAGQLDAERLVQAR